LIKNYRVWENGFAAICKLTPAQFIEETIGFSTDSFLIKSKNTKPFWDELINEHSIIKPLAKTLKAFLAESKVEISHPTISLLIQEEFDNN